MGGRPRWVPQFRVLAAIVGFSVIAAFAAPFTWPARVATALSILVLLIVVVRRGWHRLGPRTGVRASGGPGSGRCRGAAAVWVVILTVAVAVQLLAYAGEPREVYPTLSSLLEDPLATYPGRAVTHVVWLWLGWYVVAR